LAVLASETLPEFECPDLDRLGVVRVQKLAPEFFRVFTMSTKVTNFAKPDDVLEDGWLATLISTKLLDSAKIELVRNLTTLLHISYTKWRLSDWL
jgi:hypothetical protein